MSTLVPPTACTTSSLISSEFTEVSLLTHNPTHNLKGLYHFRLIWRSAVLKSLRS